MKKAVLLLLISFVYNNLVAQNKAEAEKTVKEGISFHDKGDYETAISKYNFALSIDSDNLLALGEKALSLFSLKKYEESIQTCQIAIQKHAGEQELKMIYTVYANALDGLGQTEKALKIYDDGLKQFPEYYQLYFNKGVTLMSLKKKDEAILCFQKAVTFAPKHASSHNALARILISSNRIPSLLAFCRYLTLDAKSSRAAENLLNIQHIIKGDAEQTGKKSITIHVNSDILKDTSKTENNFSTPELILAVDAGFDFEKENKHKTDTEKFIRKFETVCASMKEVQQKNSGFYWEYYAPYFIEMYDKKFIETFAYIAFASSDDKKVSKWLASHKDEINSFYDWSKSYNWSIK
jgi:Tfp pilus assembly protein PilF